MAKSWDNDSGLFQTERLIFRAWTLADGDVLHSICEDPRVMKFIGKGQPWSRDRTDRFISGAMEMLANHGYCQWAIVHRADSELVGFCGFVPANADIEIGWRLAPKYWGQGLASEAARLTLAQGFESFGFDRIIATVQTANQASIRIAEKLGMIRESYACRGGREVTIFAAHGSGHQATL